MTPRFLGGRLLSLLRRSGRDAELAMSILAPALEENALARFVEDPHACVRSTEGQTIGVTERLVVW